MYWLWKRLESYNNCTFSTWKDKFLFSLLFWIPTSFCTFHDYGRGTPFLASPDGPSLIFYHSDFRTTFLPWKTEFAPKFFTALKYFYLSGLLSNLCLPWKTECALNSLYWIYIFYHSQFWTTCACFEKQSFPWNFSLHWNIFYLLGFLRNLCLPRKQSLSWNFTTYLIYFLHSRSLSNFCLPWKQSVPEFTVFNICFLSFRILNNLRLPWKTEFALKFFTVLKYFLSFRIF